MNLHFSILIADEHEEIRLLQKDMLMKHGYFHLMEANNAEEVLQQWQENQFVIIHRSLLNGELKKLLSNRAKFLVICQPDDPEALTLAAQLGVKHLLSFPYSSSTLIERIQQVLP